jgi:hypothetical protein
MSHPEHPGRHQRRKQDDRQAIKSNEMVRHVSPREEKCSCLQRTGMMVSVASGTVMSL